MSAAGQHGSGPAIEAAVRPFTSFLGLLVLVAALPSACADQGEGERCDRENNNADCEPGLVCTAIEQLAGGEKGPPGAALCCPANSEEARVEACQGASSTIPDNDGGGTGGASGIEAGAGGSVPSTPEAGTGGSPSGPEAGIPDASADGG